MNEKEEEERQLNARIVIAATQLSFAAIRTTDTTVKLAPSRPTDLLQYTVYVFRIKVGMKLDVGQTVEREGFLFFRYVSNW